MTKDHFVKLCVVSGLSLHLAEIKWQAFRTKRIHRLT